MAEINSAIAAAAIVPLVPLLPLFAIKVNKAMSPGTRNISPKKKKKMAAPLEGLVTR